MNLDSLQLFAEVMRYGNFADVARTRGIAPSSVSRSIAGLERDIGVRLFQRSTRKLTPTEAAAVFYHRINPALKEIDAARQVAVEVDKQPGGTLRISASAVFANAAITPLLSAFAAAYPRLALELLISDSELDLDAEGIDIAIRFGAHKEPAITGKRLAATEFQVCASPQYIERHGRPLSPEDISRHRCLLSPTAGHRLDWLFRDADGNITPVAVDGQVLITQADSIKRCAIDGMGLALLPDWLAADAFRSGALLRLFDQFDVSAGDFDNAVWIVYPSRAWLPLKSRVFIDYLAQNFTTG